MKDDLTGLPERDIIPINAMHGKDELISASAKGTIGAEDINITSPDLVRHP